MTIININELDLNNKRVLIRTDLNVPIQEGKITSYARIIAALPTIKFAIKKNAKVIIMSHLGQPIEGHINNKFSLFPIFQYLKNTLSNINVHFFTNYSDTLKIKSGEVCLLENVRFNVGENKNCDILSKKYSKLCDIFVMDAFGSAHRIQSSTFGIIKYAPIACAGFLLINEINALTKIFENPIKPVVAILGGSKISTKINLLNSLTKITDTIIVGGGIANTFIAINNNVGKSLHEKKFITLAKKIYEKHNIFVPIDSRVGTSFSNKTIADIKLISQINDNEEIMDIGDLTAEKANKIISTAKTIIWNGPMGVFEFKNFRRGTQIVANSIANSQAFSIAGGGDTLSVIDMFNLKNKISYISTGGGSFLKFLENRQLPSIEMLKKNYYKLKLNH